MSTGAVLHLIAKEIVVVKIIVATVVVGAVTIISGIRLAILAILAMGFWVAALDTGGSDQPGIVPIAILHIVESEYVFPIYHLGSFLVDLLACT